MNTNVFSRVSKISLAACLALVLGANFAYASHYGQGYSQPQYSPRPYSGYGQNYGQRSYGSPSYGYQRPIQPCHPHYQPQPRYGYQGGYR